MITRSRHAQARMQQRGISEFILDLLLNFGNYQHDHHGAEIVHFSKQAKKRIKKCLPRSTYVKAEKYFNVYAVVAGQVLVTIGHRDRRIRN